MDRLQGRGWTLFYDCSALREPDETMLDTLARMQLTARRMGARIQLRNARGELCDLLELTGLAGVLGLDPHWKPEEWEEPGFDEEVH
jgi:anti-anti-sigma regulatory factor